MIEVSERLSHGDDLAELTLLFESKGLKQLLMWIHLSEKRRASQQQCE